MSTSSNLKADPDELCVLCNETRENHGDMNHMFSIDGRLVSVEPGKPARETPPKEREAPPQMSHQAKELRDDPTSRALLRLIDVFIKKGLLDARDVLYILGGGDAPE